MSNKSGKEVVSTNHPTKQHSKRPFQITCHSQPIAFPSIDSSLGHLILDLDLWHKGHLIHIQNQMLINYSEHLSLHLHLW